MEASEGFIRNFLRRWHLGRLRGAGQLITPSCWLVAGWGPSYELRTSRYSELVLSKARSARISQQARISDLARSSDQFVGSHHEQSDLSARNHRCESRGTSLSHQSQFEHR